jgi:N-acetylated-alpha-linked acidic dipeptidase
MKKSALIALAAAALLGQASPAPAGEIESKFDAGLSADSLRAWMKILTARPHHAGSPYGKANAEFMAAKMKEWGLQTTIERYDVLFPTPKSRSLELLEPTAFTATLAEPPVEGDATSGQTAEQLPTYNIYSPDGDVTGQLVYVNYGVPEDYKELERRGIDVAGKIVISRYGGAWRGIKPKVAAEHGAIGCIIFSDPGGDGYKEGEVYPKGGWRSEFSVQRGSIADMPIYAGDPLTPGVGATPDAKRLELKDATTLVKIPTLPISYHDAEPLLRALGGPVAPDNWKGALPLTYHIGPGPAKVRLALKFNWDITPIYDVVGKIPGNERPDEWVIRGNHHDAWVNGASDPVSGLVAMLSEARALGALVKGGWKPKRTIVYCAWDGEEPGLLGSTEWVETNARELKQKAVVYINSDANGRGYLGVGGSHSLEKFFNGILTDVKDPEYGISVAERARAAAIVSSTGEERARYRSGGGLELDPLGSGSDFTPFLQHLGIAALNVGYGGEDKFGQYHSIYDTYDHYTRFCDTNFSYGVTLAKTTGRAVIRMADADVVPVDFGAFATAVAGYLKELDELAGKMRDESAELRKKLDEKSLVYSSDPQEKMVPPKAPDEVPYFNFAPLQNAIALLKEKAAAYTDRMAIVAASGKPLDDGRQKELDAVLMGMERRLTLEKGLEGRPWFIHQIYAPGRYTGYGVKTIPAVREAIEMRQWPAVNPAIESAAGVLANYTAGIDEALAIINR